MAAQTILIAEDDPDIRDGVRILLAGEGYHILEAENGTREQYLYDDIVVSGYSACKSATAYTDHGDCRGRRNPGGYRS